jgi:hypothetical protein
MGRTMLGVLHGAHGVLELDQEQEPWSMNSIDRAHRVAQVVTVDSVARGCCTSIVKEKVVENWRTERVHCTGGTGQKSAYCHRVKVQAALFQSGQDAGQESKT